MERWTWPFILQQIVVLLAWCWVVRTAWREVREALEEGTKYKSGGFQMGIEHPQKTGGPVVFQGGEATRQ